MLKTVLDTRPATTLALREFLGNLPEFFLMGVSVRALFWVCFFETGVLWACLVLFRSLCFPLWLSVESRVLEMLGLESGSGLIMGDITVLWFPRKPLMRRESVDTNPLFLGGGFGVWQGFWASPVIQGMILA